MQIGNRAGFERKEMTEDQFLAWNQECILRIQTLSIVDCYKQRSCLVYCHPYIAIVVIGIQAIQTCLSLNNFFLIWVNSIHINLLLMSVLLELY